MGHKLPTGTGKAAACGSTSGSSTRLATCYGGRRLRPDHRRPGRTDHRGLRNPPRDRCADVGRDGSTAGAEPALPPQQHHRQGQPHPRAGFRDAVYNAIGAKVIGAVYEDEQYWSETRFSLPAARPAPRCAFSTRPPKEYVEFLRDENVTDAKGDEAYQLWEMFGKAPPWRWGWSIWSSPASAHRPPPCSANCARPENAARSASSVRRRHRCRWRHPHDGGDPEQIMVLFGGAGQELDRANGIVNIVLGAQRYATVVLDANGEATIPLSFGPSTSVGTSRSGLLSQHRRRLRTGHVQRSAAGRDPVTSRVSAA